LNLLLDKTQSNFVFSANNILYDHAWFDSKLVMRVKNKELISPILPLLNTEELIRIQNEFTQNSKYNKVIKKIDLYDSINNIYLEGFDLK